MQRITHNTESHRQPIAPAETSNGLSVKLQLPQTSQMTLNTVPQPPLHLLLHPAPPLWYQHLISIMYLCYTHWSLYSTSCTIPTDNPQVSQDHLPATFRRLPLQNGICGAWPFYDNTWKAPLAWTCKSCPLLVLTHLPKAIPWHCLLCALLILPVRLTESKPLIVLLRTSHIHFQSSTFITSSPLTPTRISFLLSSSLFPFWHT